MNKIISNTREIKTAVYMTKEQKKEIKQFKNEVEQALYLSLELNKPIEIKIGNTEFILNATSAENIKKQMASFKTSIW